jgi:hypothetical protein
MISKTYLKIYHLCFDNMIEQRNADCSPTVLRIKWGYYRGSGCDRFQMFFRLKQHFVYKTSFLNLLTVF